MIVFDLGCSNGHVFEGWFESLESFEDQNASEMVSCPSCEDTRIRRVPSPVAVKKSGFGDRRAAPPTDIDYGKLAQEVVKYIHDHFEDVGPRFANEALKIHYGVTEKRNIRGSATSEEEDTLQREGVDFIKMPLPDKDEDQSN